MWVWFIKHLIQMNIHCVNYHIMNAFIKITIWFCTSQQSSNLHSLWNQHSNILVIQGLWHTSLFCFVFFFPMIEKSNASVRCSAVSEPNSDTRLPLPGSCKWCRAACRAEKNRHWERKTGEVISCYCFMTSVLRTMWLEILACTQFFAVQFSIGFKKTRSQLHFQ